MKVLVLNAGSSSLKYELFREADWRALASGLVGRIGEAESELTHRWLDDAEREQARHATLRIADHGAAIAAVLDDLQACGALVDVRELSAVGHRVVHGGERFQHPTVITDKVVAAIAACAPLAPLHNPANLLGIEVARRAFPNVPHVAVFDTAFHHTLPPAAYRYALPDALYREHKVRRYGFHGTSHRYVARRAADWLARPLEATNLITLHLGNGASATAIAGGQSVDTSMGMTPLEGLVMGTRSGDLDPGVLLFLERELGFCADKLDHVLNRESGLLGLGGANDMREIHRRADAGEEGAELALLVTAHRLKKYIGAYLAILGRVDAVVFTGGIGENDADLRARVCAGLSHLGIVLDEDRNLEPKDDEREVSTAASPVKVLVIPTDEELEIAQQALAAVGGQADG